MYPFVRKSFWTKGQKTASSSSVYGALGDVKFKNKLTTLNLLNNSKIRSRINIFSYLAKYQHVMYSPLHPHAKLKELKTHPLTRTQRQNYKGFTLTHLFCPYLVQHAKNHKLDQKASFSSLSTDPKSTLES